MSNYMITGTQDCQCNNCSGPEKYFRIKNYLGELDDEVKKANARLNLGISDEFNLKWGNITGFIENQTDLTQYLDKFIEVFKQDLEQSITDIQTQLEKKIQEQIDLLEEDRKAVEALIQQLASFKEEVNQAIENKLGRDELPSIENPYNHQYYNEDAPKVTSVGQALDQLLYKELTIDAYTTPKYGEIGEVIPQVIFNWSYNKPIRLQTLDSQEIDINSRSAIINNVNTTTSRILLASDGKNTSNIVISIPFKQPVYYGVSRSIFISSEDIINSFTRDFDFDRGSEISIFANDGEYIYFLVPNNLSNINFQVGGLVGGFTIVNTNYQFVRYGISKSYVLIRSDNHSLGNTIINIQ